MIFEDREKTFEAKFAHDADMQFKAEARRNMLLGQWAAKLMGKTGVEVQTYAAAVVNASLEAPGDDDILQKLITDFDQNISEDELRAKLSEFMGVAKAEIISELE